MAIINSKKPDKLPKGKRGWVSIWNAAIEDDRLSYQARGILASMLAKPGYWDVTVESVYRGSNTERPTDGKSSINDALKELEKYGYLTREKVPVPNSNLFTWTNELRELPENMDDQGEISVSDVRHPDPRTSSTGMPGFETPSPRMPKTTLSIKQPSVKEPAETTLSETKLSPTKLDETSTTISPNMDTYIGDESSARECVDVSTPSLARKKQGFDTICLGCEKHFTATKESVQYCGRDCRTASQWKLQRV